MSADRTYMQLFEEARNHPQYIAEMETEITELTARVADQQSTIDAQAKEIEELKAGLAKRARQIGVACMEHDLTHTLACGRCLNEANAVAKVLAEWANLYTSPSCIGYPSTYQEGADWWIKKAKQQAKEGEL